MLDWRTGRTCILELYELDSPIRTGNGPRKKTKGARQHASEGEEVQSEAPEPIVEMQLNNAPLGNWQATKRCSPAPNFPVPRTIQSFH